MSRAARASQAPEAAFPVQLPFAESPWLELELARRRDLDDADRTLLRDYARDGLVVLPGVVGADLVAQIHREVTGLFNAGVQEGPASYYRRQDAWTESPAVRELALAPRVLEVLELLYGRVPHPFQTLNFLYGSQQENHSDAILFNTLPPRFMAGVWVALEDITEDNGPLFYYPGSHRLHQYYPEDFDLGAQTPDEFVNTRYPDYLRHLMATHGLERKVFLPRRGDALIWASNLVHGGTPRRDPGRTRWSQVTHYFFSDCVCYVPLYSVPAAGEYFLREVADLRHGGTITQTYNGKPFHPEPARGGRSLLRFERDLAAGRPMATSAQAVVLGATDPLALLVQSGQPSSDTRAHLDDLSDFGDALALTGWAAATDLASLETAELRVALASELSVYLLACQRMVRPDVAAALGAGQASSGFRAALEKEDLPPGTYHLGVVISPAAQPPRYVPLGRSFEVRG